MANPKGPKRTKESFIEAGKQVEADKKPFMGVKGMSWFSLLPSHDIVNGTAIDYMHGALGHMKQLLTLWLDGSHSSKIFSIAK